VVLEGPEGPVSHLVCGGVYDWSTGLLYKDGRYFDPLLGIWLALTPLAVLQLWRRRKKGRRGAWDVLFVALVVVGVGVTVAGCNTGPNQPIQACTEIQPNPIDNKMDFVTNLILSFQQLDVSFMNLPWDGIDTDKRIQSTSDLKHIVNNANIDFGLGLGSGKLGKSYSPNDISFAEEMHYGPLELALPTLAHESYQLYIGESYYRSNEVDVERMGWLIAAEVWARVRPAGYPCDKWFYMNYDQLPLPAVYEESTMITILKTFWDEHEKALEIRDMPLEEQRQFIVERYGL
jgi:hypothetical protein